MTDMTANKNRRLLQITAAMIAAVALTLCQGCKPRSSAVSKYETAPAARGAISAHVTASGTLSAVVSVDVGSQVSGKIASLKADFNSTVAQGELIAEIDPSLYLAAMRQAEGDLASAKADAILKRQNLERKKILAPQRAASQLDLDQATAELAQAEAAVIIKSAALESARANLGYCKITSPVDGIVISRKVDVGQTLVAAMTTPVLFTIAQDISRMHISAAVSEADIGQVKPGLAVDFSVDAFPEDVFHGTVSQVRKAPTTISNVVTYETIIDVDNPERRLFPGMTADVSILVAQREASLTIPNAALRFTPPEKAIFDHSPPMRLERNERLVYALAGDTTTLKPIVVKIGITDSMKTEILDGVAEGIRLVTATVSPGANRFSGN
jgi:HlyD family secretion protein